MFWALAVLAAVVANDEPHELCDARFFFHQLLAGEAVAAPEAASGVQQRQLFNFAKSMQNFVYLIGDAQTKECVAVDAAYDPEGVLARAEALGCNVTGFVATHFHWDHIGHNGQTFGGPGMHVPGMALFATRGLPTYIHESELAVAAQQVGVAREALSPLHDGDIVSVGGVALRVLHTPGHSPGGVVLVASIDGHERAALTGDTIFPGSCGRLDLPGSSVDAMHASLQHKFDDLDDALPIFPGHAYSGRSSTVGRERSSGLLRPISLSQWRRRMAR